jgi:RHS repeat-associated protein
MALLAFMPRVAQAQTEQVFYYHTDAIGSVRMITDETGQVVARYDYLPFGEPCDSLCGTPSAPDPRQFAGKEHNQETGFEYFGARFYSSGTGRFTTVDPMSVLSENMADPQLWNRYAYGRNNPLRYVDPDGRYVTDCSNDDTECQQRAAKFERARQPISDPRTRRSVTLPRLTATRIRATA